MTAGVAALALNPTWGVLAGAFFTHLVVTYVVIDLFVRMLGIDSTEPSSTADRRSPSGEARPRPTLLESTPDRRFISIAARASGA